MPRKCFTISLGILRKKQIDLSICKTSEIADTMNEEQIAESCSSLRVFATNRNDTMQEMAAYRRRAITRKSLIIS